MGDRERPSTPSPEELAAANLQLSEFLAKVKSVPEADKKLNTSEKFAGPVGREVTDED